MKKLISVFAAILVTLVLPSTLYSQIVTTIAGGGDGGGATGYSFNTPKGIATDRNGNLYVTDNQHYKVKKISATGIVTTVAGTGQSGYNSADEGKKAIYAALTNPSQLACDSSSNLYILDAISPTVRVFCVDRGGKIRTILGGGSQTSLPNIGTQLGLKITAIAVSPDGTLYAASKIPHYIGMLKNGYFSVVAGIASNGYSGDGGAATNAQIGDVSAINIDKAGNLYFFDQGANRIRKVDTFGTISTMAGNGSATYSGDGGPATAAAFNGVTGLATDTAGRLLVSDGGNNVVRIIDASGIINRWAGQYLTGGYSGDGGAALNARFNQTGAICLGIGNKVFVADVSNNVVRKIDQFGYISTWAGSGVAVSGGFTGDNGPALSASLNKPRTLAWGVNRNLLVVDVNNHRIRSIDTNGIITTIAGDGSLVPTATGGAATATGLGTVSSMVADRKGNIYYLEQVPLSIRKIDNNGIVSSLSAATTGFSGDGGPATAAKFYGATCLAVDSLGRLFIADAGNKRIRMIDTTGVVTTIAGTGSSTYFGDGGPARNAGLSLLDYIAVGDSGKVYIEDNYRIRMIDNTNTITKIAGTGTPGTPNNGVPATSTTIAQTRGLTAGSNGKLYIADISGIREIDRYGIIRATAGDGDDGDGAKGRNAHISAWGLLAAPDGRVLFAEYNQNFVRQVSFVQLSIASPDTAYCYGTVAHFSANISNNTTGRALLYNWQLNDSDLGITTSYLNYSGFKTGDSVYCIATDSITGAIVSISNGLRIRLVTVSPQLNLVLPSNTQVCVGDSARLIARATNGGTTPAYQWTKNGLPAGNDSAYSFMAVLRDVVSCTLTSNAACRLYDTMSKTAAIAIVDTLRPRVRLYSSKPDTLCSGIVVNIGTVIQTHGPVPRIDWFINDVISGTPQNYINISPNTGDSVYCRLTANGGCVTADTVYSNSVKFTVIPSGVASVSLAVTPDTLVMSNTQVTLTAIPTWGGTNPTYAWMVNNLTVATGNPFSFVPSDYNRVLCVMKSNYECIIDTFCMAEQLFRIDNSPVFEEDAIYPNPNTSSFMLYQPIEGKDSTDVGMSVYNTLGQTVYQETLLLMNNRIERPFNFDRRLPEGVYYVDLQYYTGRKMLKFVVKY